MYCADPAFHARSFIPQPASSCGQSRTSKRSVRSSAKLSFQTVQRRCPVPPENERRPGRGASNELPSQAETVEGAESIASPRAYLNVNGIPTESCALRGALR